MGKLDGRVALVTGAAMGIGEGIASVMAKHGATVVLADVNEHVFVTTKHLEDKGYKVFGKLMDVVKLQQVKEVMDEILEQFGKIDILVNNAGMGTVGLFNELTEDDINKTFDVNVRGVLNCSRAVIQNMASNHFGKIINIASVTGVKVSDPGFSVYGASKGAIMGFTKSLAVEVGKLGITVNAVLPGVIDTPMFNQGVKESFSKSRVEIVEALEYGIPLNRMGTTEDIGEVVSFLASAEGSYVTGTSITVDGGGTLTECAGLLLDGGLAGLGIRQ
ncbi:MAG TPA: glucose 1-dehydrogenase [Metabacillus sp.]|nr:glucose 1-dehydrogenase [Metabacillus sp.]